MEKLAIAIGLITQGDTYVLQLRAFAAEKGGAGKIGCFGGKIDTAAGETAQQACLREIVEETNLRPRMNDLKPLGELHVISDHNLQDKAVHIHVFSLIVQDVAFKTRAEEGQLVRIPKTKIKNYLTKMTPGTSEVFKKFVLGED